MEDKVFKFYFKKDNLYYHVEGGSVVLSASKVAVDHSVDGWKDIKLSYVRNMTYWGVFKKYGIDLRFTNEGATILRTVYYQESFQGKCTLMIEKLNSSTQLYEFWDEIGIDFSKAKDSDNFMDCTLLDDGAEQLLESRKDTGYEIDLAPIIPRIDVMLSSLWINYYYKWIGAFTGKEVGVLAGSFIGQLWMPMPNATSQDYDYFEYLLYKKNQGTIGDNPVYSPYDVIDTDYLMQSFSDDNLIVTVKLSGVAKINVHNHGTFTVGIQTQRSDGSFTGNTLMNVNLLAGDNTVTLLANINDTIVLEKGKHVFYTTVSPSASTGTGVFTFYDIDANDITIELSGVARLPPSWALSMRYIDFAKEIVKQMTDGKYQLQSHFLSNPNTTSAIERKKNYDNSPYNTMVTCGDALKNNTVTKLKASFADILKDCWATWGLVLYIQNDNVFRLEPLSDVLAQNNLGTLGKVNNFSIYPFTSNTFNKITVGQKDFDYGQLSGQYEQSNEQQYLLDSVTRYETEDDLSTPFRKDIYGIEWVRREIFNTVPDPDGASYIGGSTGENDVFIIEVDPTPKFTPRFNTYTFQVYTQGIIISPFILPGNIYNVPLTTKRMLLRHLRRIRSLTMDGKIVFQTSGKNYRLQSILSSGQINEDSDLILDTTVSNTVYFPTSHHETFGGERLFQPFVFEFDCVPDNNMIGIVNSPPHGYFVFEYRGSNFKGYILDIGVVPATKDKYNFKLLCHQDNNVRNLIK